MFTTIKNKLRRLLHDMKLLKGNKTVSEAIKLPVSEAMYEKIDNWKQIYTGYFPEWHDVEYHTIAGKRSRTRASMKMPKVVAQKMATLIFNERCEVNISDQTLEQAVKEIFKKNKFNSEFSRYLEYAFAMGGMAMKVYYEDGEIKIAYNTADTFIPTAWSNSRVTEGIFESSFTKNGKYYTLLEYNIKENGKFVIKNELYESNLKHELGIKINLQSMYPDMVERIEFSEMQSPIFVYFKPNTANNFDTQSPLGISLFANSLDTLKTLDIAFDSFQREFILGKKRILVPTSAIQVIHDPQTGQAHRYFDAEDEVFQAMEDGLDEDGKITDISVELRVDEHVSAINAILKVLAMQMGMNAGAFTFDGTGIKTATEVVSENSETFRTKQSHEINAEIAIQELVQAIVEVADAFNVFPRVTDYEVSVNFDDSIAEDKQAEIDRQILLVGAQLTTKVKALQVIHGITEVEAIEMLAQINAEAKQEAFIVPEATDLLGAGPTQQLMDEEEEAI
ncbi:phage portal protein [Bacillus paranthracis]|uniref:phage portal protein n=1 Tax=Bacillus paranthracis TaxID=2026186 RepID=UPI003D652602